MERLTERDENGVAFAKSPDAAVKMFDKLADYEDLEEKLIAHTGMNVCDLIEGNTDGIDLLLEYVSESTKAYNQLEIHGWSSQEDMFRKIIMADSIIHNQSKIIDKLTKIRR